MYWTFGCRDLLGIYIAETADNNCKIWLRKDRLSQRLCYMPCYSTFFHFLPLSSTYFHFLPTFRGSTVISKIVYDFSNRSAEMKNRLVKNITIYDITTNECSKCHEITKRNKQFYRSVCNLNNKYMLNSKHCKTVHTNKEAYLFEVLRFKFDCR